MKKAVNFPCGKLILEGVIYLPPGKPPLAGVMVCHPHPLYGGTMDNPVVLAICQALEERGVACLRFNLRGVGKSSGSFGGGIKEQEDVKAALSFLSQQEEVDSARLGLCGYSFGALVCLPVADQDERVQAVTGISPFLCSSSGLLQNFAHPKFFICGSRDEFMSHEGLQREVAQLPEPKKLEIVPGADHFWWGYEDELGSKVADFFATVLSKDKM